MEPEFSALAGESEPPGDEVAASSAVGDQTKMATGLRSIDADPEHYSRAFKVFSAAYDRPGVYGVWIKEIFPDAVLGRLRHLAGKQDELRMLGVGSGSGETECDMFQQLLPTFPRIYNRVVEPNAALLSQYGELAAAKAHELRGVRFEWHQQTIEEHEKARELESTKFHVISAFHSLYYVEDVRHTLMHMHDLLEPDGVLLIMTISDEDQCFRLRQHFRSFGLCRHLVSAADIRAILAREGVLYSTVRQRFAIDISECFIEGSEDGDLLLDLLLMVINFRQAAPADLQAKVLAHLATNTSPGDRDDGKVFLGGSHDLFIIKKSAL